MSKMLAKSMKEVPGGEEQITSTDKMCNRNWAIGLSG